MAELDQSANPAGASAPAPSSSAPAPDLEAIVQRIVGENDKRFQGFQSMIDRKLGDVSRQFEAKLKTVGLPQEEREQLEAESEAEEVQRLLRENTLLKLRQDKPDAVDFFMKVMSADTLEDQLAVIEETLGAKAAAQVEQAVEDAQQGTTDTTATPEIDTHNPARTKGASIAGALQGQEMTDELAEAVLASGSKGILHRLRLGQQG
jgi:hypothetical protein